MNEIQQNILKNAQKIISLKNKLEHERKDVAQQIGLINKELSIHQSNEIMRVALEKVKKEFTDLENFHSRQLLEIQDECMNIRELMERVNIDQDYKNLYNELNVNKTFMLA